MKILVVNMYSKPEFFSSSHFVYELFDEIQQRDNDVTFVAPNPVRGLSKSQIKMYKDIRTEIISDIAHIRLWCGSNNGNNIIGRFARMFLFQLKLHRFLKKHITEYDLIYIPSNPPIFIPRMIEKTAKKHKIFTVYQIDDIFPDIIGKNNIVHKYLKHVAFHTYQDADYLVTLSEDMENTLINKGISKDKISIFRIWPNNNFIQINNSNSVIPVFDDLFFNITYFGNIGQFQNLDLLLDIAEYLKDNHRIKFLIAGSGRKYKHIEKEIIKRSLSNVELYSRIPEQYSNQVYMNSDLNIICLNKSVIHFACPSKTSPCITSGKPCLVLCDDSYYTRQLEKNYNFYVNSSYDVCSISNQIIDIVSGNTPRDFKNNKTIKTEYNKDINLKKWLNLMTIIGNEITKEKK